MSLNELKDEAARLSDPEQRELIAFLLSLRADKDAAFRQKLASKIDDHDPTHWTDFEELQARLSK